MPGGKNHLWINSLSVGSHCVECTQWDKKEKIWKALFWSLAQATGDGVAWWEAPWDYPWATQFEVTATECISVPLTAIKREKYTKRRNV